MGMHDTTARKVATERIREAQKNIKSLKTYLDQVDQAMEDFVNRDLGGGFYTDWGEGIMKGAFAICNEIARCNGAVLVRATTPAKKPRKTRKSTGPRLKCLDGKSECVPTGGPECAGCGG